jgi:hypothetical protein
MRERGWSGATGSKEMVRVGSDLERNKSVVRRFLDVVSDGGDLSVLDEVCSSVVVNHAARPGLVAARSEV